jgi:hypothetical protein
MKTRQGFVSNSSSSSFIIATREKLTKKNLDKIFRVPETGIFKNIAKEMATIFFDNAEEITVEEFLDDYDYDSLDEIEGEYGDFIRKAYNNNFTVYHGYVSDDEGGMEEAAVSLEINYEDENIIMWKESYY